MRRLIFIGIMVLTLLRSYGQHHVLKPKTTSIELGLGYKQEQLDWSIAGNLQGKAPNVLSELSWNKLQGPTSWLRAETMIWKGLSVAVDFSSSKTIAGKGKDVDYGGDDRTDKVFDMGFKSNRGYHLAYNAMLGYLFVDRYGFSSTVFLGYHRQAQKLFLLDDGDLQSSYHSKWQGPAAQLALRYRQHTLAYEARISYSQLRYHAEADWNLIEAFAKPKSFEHKAKGYALGLLGKISLFPSKQLQPALFIAYQQATSGQGVDYLYRADGSTRLTQFNGVRGSILTAGIALKYLW